MPVIFEFHIVYKTTNEPISSIQAKRNILSKLGSNLVWEDKELSIYNDNSINKLVEGIKYARVINPKFEPKNIVVNESLNEKTEVFSSVFSSLLGD